MDKREFSEKLFELTSFSYQRFCETIGDERESWRKIFQTLEVAQKQIPEDDEQ